MAYDWIRDKPARWDADKQRIIGSVPAGIFDPSYAELELGASLPGDWWRVEDAGRVLGYGWLDIVWGEGEILLATDAAARGRGVGTFIIEQLEREAEARGLNYLYNSVAPTHPNAESVTTWLVERGFKASDDGSLFRNIHEERPGKQ